MEIIRTDIPIDNNSKKNLKKITAFWNRTTPLWQQIWGQHIHHGYFEGKETSAIAQEKLIEKIAENLNLMPGQKLLDVGCGMGGSSIYLSNRYQVQVTGISLSTTQLTIAKEKAATESTQSIQFAIEDAHSLASFANDSFDIVWSLESCEQFYDKNLFIQQARRILKPKGQLMIATWCAAEEQFTNKLAKEYKKICNAFDTPYMPTFQYYMTVLKNNGFQLQQQLDWSPHVKSSWRQGMVQFQSYPVWKLLRYVGLKEILFLHRIKLMQKFFEEGLIKYGVFIAEK